MSREGIKPWPPALQAGTLPKSYLAIFKQKFDDLFTNARTVFFQYSWPISA
jgi:hypothetical protein